MSEKTDLDLGPLAGLVGTWRGDKGVDVSAEPEGQDEDPYFETMTFEIVGDVTNAGEQTLSVLRYHQVVSRKSDGEQFHDEVGYWMWDPATKTVSQSLVIPRGVAILAGGSYESGNTIEVAASLDDPHWSIVQSPFMAENAKTTAFRHKILLEGDQLTYSETTVLDIYGRSFDHTDDNVLTHS